MSTCNGSHWCSQTVVNAQSMSAEPQFPKEIHTLLVHSPPGTLCLPSVALISLRLLLWKASSGLGFHRCLWSSFSFHENKAIFHPSSFSQWFQTDTGTSMPVIFSGLQRKAWLAGLPFYCLPKLAFCQQTLPVSLIGRSFVVQDCGAFGSWSRGLFKWSWRPLRRAWRSP